MDEQGTSEIVAEIAKQPHLINLLSSEISSHLDKRLQERENRVLKIVGALTAAILFIGYAGIKEMITASSNAAAESAVSKRAGQFEVPIVLATLTTALDRAANRGQFLNTEREEMISSLEALREAREKGFDVTSNPQFLSVLERVIDTMAASNNDLLVDRAYDMFPEKCLETSGIVQTLLQHYGRLAITGTVTLRRDAIKRFDAVERSSSTHKLPEYSLPHRVLIDFFAGGRKPTDDTKEFARRVGELDERDRRRAWTFWTDYANEAWVVETRSDSVFMKNLTRDFIRAHEKLLLEQGFDFSGLEDYEVNTSGSSGT